MGKRVLVVVDMQKDFVDGSLGSKEAVSIVPAVVKKARDFDGTVLFTRDTHGEDYMQTNEGKHLPVPHCIKGTDGWQICSALMDGLFAEKDYTVVDKPSFGYTGWREVIAAQEADGSDLQIELIGICTDICVVSNALILKAYYPEATVKVDAGCCAGVTKEAHAAALQTMKSCQVEVTNEA